MDAGESSAGVQRAVRAFLDEVPQAQATLSPTDSVNPEAAQASANNDPRQTLARALRRQAIPVVHETALRRLLILDTCTRLALSNPKYLAAHQQGARDMATVQSGD